MGVSYLQNRFLFLGLVLMFSILGACKTEPFEPIDPDVKVFNPTPKELIYPKWFPEMPLSHNNPLTEEGIALGRRLYYDPIMHPNGVQSCSSCHDQKQSFTVSTPAGQTAVLAHVNLGWSNKFLWNGKVEGSLEDIMMFEVDEFFATDLSRLQAHPDYPELFFEAFGQRTITSELCASALAQFFRSMISTNSRFDQYYPGKIQPTPAEVRGYEIFTSEKGDCFHCHPQPLFTDNSFHNIGLESSFEGQNLGRFTVTDDATDKGLFKTPTLRNIALTAPYMHDNRFQTLEEVIEHYDHGVQKSASLDPIMTKPNQINGLQLTVQDKADLLAFLQSLTDTTYTNNTSLSAP